MFATGVSRTEDILAAVNRKNEVGIPMFSLAFGDNADWNLVQKLSDENDGFARKIYEDSDASLQIAGFYDELAVTLLKDVEIKYLDDSVDEQSLTRSDYRNYYQGKLKTKLKTDIKNNHQENQIDDNIWAAPSEFGTYRLCEQRRFRRACASAQSRQNLRCSLIQAVSQEELSDRKPDPWPLWMVGHAQLKFVMTECSKTQICLTGLIL